MVRRTIDSLYALTIPEVQEMFLQVMQNVVDQAILEEMIKAIQIGDAEALFQATGFTPAALGPILDRLERAYKDSADITVDGWPNRIRTPTGLTIFRFDARNTAVEDDLRTSSSEFVTRLTDEARQNTRDALERGMRLGQNPRQTALDIVGRIDPVTKKRIGGVIGLTQNQMKWVLSAEEKLKNLDRSYFTMGLRDKRFDNTVLRAIEQGKPLPASQIDKLVTAYKSSALKYRAESIARTETIHTINRGEYASYRQATDDGTIKKSAITKEWDDVSDSRVRTTHNEMGKRYGKNKGISVEEPFISKSGSRLLHPGDTSLNASASEIIFCRCKARYRVNWIANAE